MDPLASQIKKVEDGVLTMKLELPGCILSSARTQMPLVSLRDM